MDKEIMKEAHLLCVLEDIAVEYARSYNLSTTIDNKEYRNKSKKIYFEKFDSVQSIINKAFEADNIFLKVSAKHDKKGQCLFDTVFFVDYKGDVIEDSIINV